MADDILEIVAEDQQKQHIAKNMHDAPVHEHRAEKIEINRQRRRIMLYLAGVPQRVADDLDARDIDAGRYLLRNKRKGVCKGIVVAQPLKQHENENIQRR